MKFVAVETGFVNLDLVAVAEPVYPGSSKLHLRSATGVSLGVLDAEDFRRQMGERTKKAKPTN